jgi:hypothetical protein
MTFVQATPMHSIDGITRAVAADIMSDRTALANIDESVQILIGVQYCED